MKHDSGLQSFLQLMMVLNLAWFGGSRRGFGKDRVCRIKWQFPQWGTSVGLFWFGIACWRKGVGALSRVGALSGIWKNSGKGRIKGQFLYLDWRSSEDPGKILGGRSLYAHFFTLPLICIWQKRWVCPWAGRNWTPPNAVSLPQTNQETMDTTENKNHPIPTRINPSSKVLFSFLHSRPRAPDSEIQRN